MFVWKDTWAAGSVGVKLNCTPLQERVNDVVMAVFETVNSPGEFATGFTGPLLAAVTRVGILLQVSKMDMLMGQIKMLDGRFLWRWSAAGSCWREDGVGFLVVLHSFQCHALCLIISFRKKSTGDDVENTEALSKMARPFRRFEMVERVVYSFETMGDNLQD